ncbi:hypothetical protein TYRP_005163 [Tyrophagus putrescentiae]|nr:hypothetical protein TYRP_005163 [Tyrophagus putrescentiae]
MTASQPSSRFSTSSSLLIKESTTIGQQTLITGHQATAVQQTEVIILLLQDSLLLSQLHLKGERRHSMGHPPNDVLLKALLQVHSFGRQAEHLEKGHLLGTLIKRQRPQDALYKVQRQAGGTFQLIGVDSKAVFFVYNFVLLLLLLLFRFISLILLSTATTSGDSGRRSSVSSRRRVDVDVLPRQGPQRIGKADRGAGARVDHGHGGQLAVGSCRQQLFSAAVTTGVAAIAAATSGASVCDGLKVTMGA